ncbi:MAG: hypothetical protein ABSF98_02215 [Bryobacteraceae bacterium]
MFKAVQSAKVRINEDVGPVQCADIFKRNEDFLTAAVFSRLLYMPPETISKVLPMYDVHPGEVIASAFWPEWSVESQGETHRVEPDVYIQFTGFDLIVEAKLDDVASYPQTAEQWANEWAAWQQEHLDDERRGMLLAIGGLGRTESDVKTKVTRLAAEAESYLRARLPRVPPIHAVGISWQSLYERLGVLRKEVSPQLLADLRAILGYFGFRGHQYLADLSEVGRQATGSPIDAGSMDIIWRGHGAQIEPDWIVAWRGLSPISDASITALPRGDHGK